MEYSKDDLYITLDDYAMQDDERDLDFSPGQKRSRRGVRKNSSGSTIPLSTSLPSTSGIHMPKGSEMKVRDYHHAAAMSSTQASGTPAPYVRLERSRQSARECRARKKLRYQYLEELVKQREKAVITLREEFSKQYLEMYRLLEKGIYAPEIDMLLNDQPEMANP